MSLRTLALVIIAAFPAASFSQIAEPVISPTPTPTPERVVQKEDIVRFINATATDIANLRLPENRVAFMAEAGTILWPEDEQQARRMIQGVAGDMRSLISQADAAALAELAQDPDGGSMAVGFGFNPGGKAVRRLKALMTVRDSVALGIAAVDTDSAIDLVEQTSGLVTTPSVAKDIVASDVRLMTRLAAAIGQRDPAKAVAIAIEALKKGIAYEHISLLETIAKKDRTSAGKLADAILARVSSDDVEPYMLQQLLTVGEGDLKGNPSTPLYDAAEMRTIAERLCDIVDKRGYGEYMLNAAAKWAPAKVQQIRAKLAAKSGGRGMGGGIGNGVSVASGIAAPPPPMARPRGMAVSVGGSSSGAVAAGPAANKAVDEANARRRAFESLAGMKKEMSVEERGKILDQARAVASQMRSPSEKIMALGAIAAQAAKLGENEVAIQILRDAEQAAPVDPRSYDEYLAAWMLAAAYADVDPDQSIAKIEAIIMRLNDTVGAAAKVMEFIDVRKEMVSDGEFMIGPMAVGEARGMLSMMQMFGPTLRTLAKYDLQKTESLADRIERPEVRVLVKMQMLRAFSDKSTNSGTRRMGMGSGASQTIVVD